MARPGFGLAGALLAATMLTSGVGLAGKTVNWNYSTPPIVPHWAPSAMIQSLDRDRDGLHDDFEESVAAAFAPKYLFDSEEDYRRLAGESIGPEEPVLLHAVTPL